MKTYLLSINIERVEEGYWYAEVPMLLGCSLSCYPLEHVLDSIQDMAQAVLEVIIENGEPLPEGLELCEIAPGSEPAFSMEAVTVSV